MQQRQVPTVQTVQKTMQNPQAQFLDEVVGMPVVVQRKVQETLEVPQLQLIGKVVDVPSVMQRRVPTIQRVQKTVEVPRPSTVLGILLKKRVEALHVVDFAHEFAEKQDPTTKDGVNLGDENRQERAGGAEGRD